MLICVSCHVNFLIYSFFKVIFSATYILEIHIFKMPYRSYSIVLRYTSIRVASFKTIILSVITPEREKRRRDRFIRGRTSKRPDPGIYSVLFRGALLRRPAFCLFSGRLARMYIYIGGSPGPLGLLPHRGRIYIKHFLWGMKPALMEKEGTIRSPATTRGGGGGEDAGVIFNRVSRGTRRLM